jgi:hypothetical protein
MNNLCTTECSGISPGFSLDNLYYDCAEQNDCPRGLGQLPSKECVEKNKDVIFNCCRSNCQPTSITDCQELCETLQKTILDPASLGISEGLYKSASALEGEKVKNQKSEIKDIKDVNTKINPVKNSIYPYLWSALGIGLVIALCILLGNYLYHKKRK